MGFRFSRSAWHPREEDGVLRFPYMEFLDIMDVPAYYTLTFRVSLADRPMKGASLAGTEGWVGGCSIVTSFLMPRSA